MNIISSLKENKYLLIAFTVLILSNLASFLVKSAKPELEEKFTEADTVIPKGYVLIPVDLQNFDAISGVIQDYGVVDLYSNNPETMTSKKLASKIKLIRAPYNPNTFAVLAKEEYSDQIVRSAQNLYAIIQNKKTTEEMKLSQYKSKNEVSIEYQQEGQHE